MQYLFPEEAVRDLYAIRPELEPMFERIDKTLIAHLKELEKHSEELHKRRDTDYYETYGRSRSNLAGIIVMLTAIFILQVCILVNMAVKTYTKLAESVPVQEQVSSSECPCCGLSRGAAIMD